MCSLMMDQRGPKHVGLWYVIWIQILWQFKSSCWLILKKNSTVLAALLVIPDIEIMNFSLFSSRWFSFLLGRDNNVMVVKSIHSLKNLSKSNGFWFDYFGRRKVKVTVEWQPG
jgi:hypothetical protein